MKQFLSPFQELEALRRGFDQVFSSGAWPGLNGPGSRFLPGESARNYPLANIRGDAERFVVEAFAPGLDIESLDVSVQGDTLTIAGEKKPLPNVSPEAYHRSERSVGKFVRSYRLGSEIDEDAVTARYANGILTITLPKSEAAKPKRIPVNSQ